MDRHAMKVPLYQNNRIKGLPDVHSVITQSFPKGTFYVNPKRMYCSGSLFSSFSLGRKVFENESLYENERMRFHELSCSFIEIVIIVHKM